MADFLNLNFKEIKKKGQKYPLLLLLQEVTHHPNVGVHFFRNVHKNLLQWKSLNHILKKWFSHFLALFSRYFSHKKGLKCLTGGAWRFLNFFKKLKASLLCAEHFARTFGGGQSTILEISSCRAERVAVFR